MTKPNASKIKTFVDSLRNDKYNVAGINRLINKKMAWKRLFLGTKIPEYASRHFLAFILLIYLTSKFKAGLTIFVLPLRYPWLFFLFHICL